MLGEMLAFLQLPTGAKHDDALHRWTQWAKRWCTERGMDLAIMPLTTEALNMGTAMYPELSSRIKASRTRALLAYTAHFAIEVASGLVQFIFFFCSKG